MIVSKIGFILSLVSLCRASEHGKLFEKYAEKKVMQACFGEDELHNYKREIHGYTEQCIIECDEPSHAGRRRRAVFSADRIRQLKSAHMYRIDVMSCVLKKMGICDENMNVQPNQVKKMIQEWNLEEHLRDDLIGNVDKCYEMSQCVSVDPKETPVPLALAQTMAFMKCEKERKWKACMKKDLRKCKGEFELEGLDGLMDGFDDDDKMLNIMMASAVNDNHGL